MFLSGSCGSHRFSIVLSGCRIFLLVLYGCHGFSVDLVRSRKLSVVLVDSQCFSVVLPVGSRRGSCRISMVLSGSRNVSVVFCCYHWFS